MSPLDGEVPVTILPGNLADWQLLAQAGGPSRGVAASSVDLKQDPGTPELFYLPAAWRAPDPRTAAASSLSR